MSEAPAIPYKPFERGRVSKPRSFRLDAALLDEAQAKARREGTALSGVVEDCLIAYIEGRPCA